LIIDFIDSENATIVSVGMEDQSITDSQIIASSYYAPNVAPWLGRLNVIRGEGAWASLFPRRGEFLQIDLYNKTAIFKVATKGRAVNALQYVTSYSLKYSIDGAMWLVYKPNGVKKVCLNN